MDREKRRVKKKIILVGILWLLFMILLGCVGASRLSNLQRQKQLALLGRLTPLFEGKEADLLEAFMLEDSEEQWNKGTELLSRSSFASRGYRELGRSASVDLFLLAWCLLMIIGVLLLFVYALRTRRRYGEVEKLGDSLFMWNRQEITVKEPETAYLQRCLLQYQEQLQKKQESWGVEQKKQTRYLENLVHQIKTPLAGISLCHDYMEAVEVEPKKQQILGESRGQIQHLETLVHQLLLLARLDAGKGNMKLERVALEEIMENVRQMTGGLAEEKKLDIQWNYDEETVVLCDRFWIREVILNILKNGIEHSPEQGRIEIWTEKGYPGVDIHIRDHGQGIPVEEQEQIFQRFYTENTAENRRNTGIGLNLAYEIMQKHGGKLELMEHDGNGAWFRLRLYS